jgi:hypothetical protein
MKLFNKQTYFKLKCKIEREVKTCLNEYWEFSTKGIRKLLFAPLLL